MNILYIVIDMDPNAVTGIILAGGTSSRMGFDKGLSIYKGKPLIQYAINTLQHICSQILISTNSSAYDELGLTIQEDITPGKGPMGGVYSALKNSPTDHNLLLSYDTPFVTRELMHLLLDNSRKFQIVIPESKHGFLEPLIGYYHKNNAAAMMSFIESGNLKLIDYIETTYYKTIPVYKYPEHNDPNQFTNINSPEDLTGLGK